MPVGLEIQLDNGVYQISENTIWLTLQQSDQINISNTHIRGLSNNCHYADIVYQGRSGSIPFIALRGVEGLLMGVEKISLQGTTWTFRVTVAGKPTLSRLIKYYIFDKPVPTQTGAGLEIYDSSGNLAVSSNRPPMVVKGPLATSYPQDEYAIISGAAWGSMEDIDTEDGQRFTYHWAYYFNGASVTPNGGYAGEYTTAEERGDGASGLPDGVPTGYGSNTFQAVVRVRGFPLGVRPQ